MKTVNRIASQLILAVIPAVLLASGAIAQQRGGPTGPTPVGVISATTEVVPVRVSLPGRAAAYQMASIRPKVGGEITDILYRSGQQVEPGTALFRLEDETLAAELSAREAASKSAEAALAGAQATVDRYRKLSGSGVSRAEVEQAEVALAAAEAALGSARAQRDLAQLAVRRTQIDSPIAGVVALSGFSVGDIVSAGQPEILTTVMQIDPIYVDVSESRARILRNLQRVDAGTLQRRETTPPAQLTLETGETYDQPGHVLSPGWAVSATTGTIPIRLEFANPDRIVLPGQFVRVSLTVGEVEAVLVPQRATSRSASGALTAFVARDGKADQVTLTETGTYQNAWIVTEGVNNGDALIVDGLQNLRDGAEVAPVPAAIDADGVVTDAEPESSVAAVSSVEPGPGGQAVVRTAADAGSSMVSGDATTEQTADQPTAAKDPVPEGSRTQNPADSAPPDSTGAAPPDSADAATSDPAPVSGGSTDQRPPPRPAEG